MFQQLAQRSIALVPKSVCNVGVVSLPEPILQLRIYGDHLVPTLVPTVHSKISGDVCRDLQSLLAVLAVPVAVQYDDGFVVRRDIRAKQFVCSRIDTLIIPE